jgi:hypothetical protein
MVRPRESLRILETLVSVYPEQGVVLSVKLWPGWANSLQVEVETGRDPHTGLKVDHEQQSAIRDALLSAVSDSRPMVKILHRDLWNDAGPLSRDLQ